MSDLALLATYSLTATQEQRAAVAAGQALDPADVTAAQQTFFAVCYVGGLLLVSAVGIGWLLRLWRSASPTPAADGQTPAQAWDTGERAAPGTR
jgi:hypothetical protein